MTITTIIESEDGEIYIKRKAKNWESAAENFGKLERYYKSTTRCRKCGAVMNGFGLTLDEDSLCGNCAG